MSSTVKIAVAEPSVIIRNGILLVLKRLNMLHIEVFEISEMEQLRFSLSKLKPDILMINPDFVGLFPLQQIKKESGNLDLKCVALQFSLTNDAALKSYDGIIAIHNTADQIKEKLTKLIYEPQKDCRHQSLSAREKEVIVLVIKGMTNKQIAENLFLSTHTVITHRRNISAKLQINTVAGLTIYAIVNKLVVLDDLKETENQQQTI